MAAGAIETSKWSHHGYWLHRSIIKEGSSRPMSTDPRMWSLEVTLV
jgi:Tol biopolymer transport system component